MTIYIDSDCKCYTTPADDRRQFETDFFDGKCAAYIEGYRYIPEGETWEREDGIVFYGFAISPWKDWRELDAAQRDYEREQLATITAENEALVSDMAQMVEEIYQSDTEMMGL